MVKARVLLAALTGLVVMMVLAPPAAGLVGPQPPGTGDPSSPPPSSSGGTQSSSGGPKWDHVRNCSLYATASSFGLSCATGSSSGGQTKTVKQVLGHDKPPSCWDEAIPAADQVQKYDLPPAPDGTTYYLHYCITSLDLNAPVGSPDAMQLNVKVLEIDNGAKPCPSPQPADQEGRCIMTLTANQQQVVELSQPAGGQIPEILVVQQPSTRVRTKQPIAYQNRGGDGMTRTATYQVGAVRMWAELSGYSIQPYGPGTAPKIPCDGSLALDGSATPASAPGACWWTYPQSSAQQPGEVYPFRAEADWAVYVDDGTGQRVFATFQKFDDLRVPVFDVQTLVVH